MSAAAAPLIPDWGLHVNDVPPKGRGVFTSVDIPPSALVFKFTGPVFSRDTCPNFDESIQVGADAFMWSSGGVDDMINHSCEPNVGLCSLADGLYTQALRAIPAGAELTYDYSTAMLSDPTTMLCACGAPACRGRIGNFFDLPVEAQRAYAAAGALPGFVLQAAAARGAALPAETALGAEGSSAADASATARASAGASAASGTAGTDTRC